MTAEERKARAINITRTLVKMAMNNPHTIIEMATYDRLPEDMEDTIRDILEYLEKTEPEGSKEAEG